MVDWWSDLMMLVRTVWRHARVADRSGDGGVEWQFLVACHCPVFIRGEVSVGNDERFMFWLGTGSTKYQPFKMHLVPRIYTQVFRGVSSGKIGAKHAW